MANKVSNNSFCPSGTEDPNIIKLNTVILYMNKTYVEKNGDAKTGYYLSKAKEVAITITNGDIRTNALASLCGRNIKLGKLDEASKIALIIDDEGKKKNMLERIDEAKTIALLAFCDGYIKLGNFDGAMKTACNIPNKGAKKDMFEKINTAIKDQAIKDQAIKDHK